MDGPLRSLRLIASVAIHNTAVIAETFGQATAATLASIAGELRPPAKSRAVRAAETARREQQAEGPWWVRTGLTKR